MNAEDRPVELLAGALLTMRRLGVFDRGLISNLLRATLESRPDTLAVWAAWEPDTFDGRDAFFRQAAGHNAHGRFVPYWHRADGDITLELLRGYDEPGKGDWYSFVRRHGQTCVIAEPLLYPIGASLHWVTSEITPILEHGTFLGAVGFDWAASPTRRSDATIPITHVLTCPSVADHLHLLTAREREVHYWVCKGKSNDDIGVILGISSNTVKNHLSMIFQKLGVENRYAAALMGR